MSEKFKDAKLPEDTIEVGIRYEAHGDLVEIKMTTAAATEVLHLSKETAENLGNTLISKAKEII